MATERVLPQSSCKSCNIRLQERGIQPDKVIPWKAMFGVQRLRNFLKDDARELSIALEVFMTRATLFRVSVLPGETPRKDLERTYMIKLTENEYTYLGQRLW